MSMKSVLLALLAVVGLAGIGLAAPAPSIPDPVARVNGQPITQEAFLERLRVYHGVYVLENMIGESLLEAEAKKRGVAVTEQEIAQRVEELKKADGLLSAETFRSWLVMKEYTEVRYRDKARIEILAEKTFAKEAQVRDDEVEKYYNDRKADFTLPATATLRAMTVSTEELAKKALELLRGGKDFPATAKELGPTGVRSFTENPVTIPLAGLPPTLRVQVEKAPLNQAFGPVKQPQNPQDPNSPAIGYMVLVVEGRTVERLRLFSEVKDDIRRAMFNQRVFGSLGVFPRWMGEAMQKATIERFLTFTGEPKTGAPSAAPKQ